MYLRFCRGGVVRCGDSLLDSKLSLDLPPCPRWTLADSPPRNTPPSRSASLATRPWPCRGWPSVEGRKNSSSGGGSSRSSSRTTTASAQPSKACPRAAATGAVAVNPRTPSSSSSSSRRSGGTNKRCGRSIETTIASVVAVAEPADTARPATTTLVTPTPEAVAAAAAAAAAAATQGRPLLAAAASLLETRFARRGAEGLGQAARGGAPIPTTLLRALLVAEVMAMVVVEVLAPAGAGTRAGAVTATKALVVAIKRKEGPSGTRGGSEHQRLGTRGSPVALVLVVPEGSHLPRREALIDFSEEQAARSPGGGRLDVSFRRSVQDMLCRYGERHLRARSFPIGLEACSYRCAAILFNNLFLFIGSV